MWSSSINGSFALFSSKDARKFAVCSVSPCSVCELRNCVEITSVSISDISDQHRTYL